MNSIKEEVTLRECPFCGDPDSLLVTHSSDAGNEYSVRCQQGCCEIGDEYRTEVIAAWNTRRPTSDLRAKAEGLAEALRKVLPYTEAERLAEAAQVRLRRADRVPIQRAVEKASAILSEWEQSQ